MYQKKKKKSMNLGGGVKFSDERPLCPKLGGPSQHGRCYRVMTRGLERRVLESILTHVRVLVPHVNFLIVKNVTLKYDD